MSRHTAWQPTAALETLQMRAKIMQKIRHFFDERGLLEVETPLLSQHSVTDPYIQSFEAVYENDAGNPQSYFLQTSPEYAMKRLIASGFGDVYQLCKAFRNHGEIGSEHNPEFTLLEWYRMGFDHHQLMDEMDDFLQYLLNCSKAQRFSYQHLFLHFLKIDPFELSAEDLKQFAQKNKIQLFGSDYDWDDWTAILLSHLIEPQLDPAIPVFIYDCPASQAALSKIRNDRPKVGERFEVYFKGIELANGFHELQNADEQLKRFQNDQQKRKNLNLKPMQVDQRFIAALKHGLPNCSGVAVGIDRLIMLALSLKTISESMAFDFNRA